MHDVAMRDSEAKPYTRQHSTVMHNNHDAVGFSALDECARTGLKGQQSPSIHSSARSLVCSSRICNVYECSMCEFVALVVEAIEGIGSTNHDNRPICFSSDASEHATRHDSHPCACTTTSPCWRHHSPPQTNRTEQNRIWGHHCDTEVK